MQKFKVDLYHSCNGDTLVYAVADVDAEIESLKAQLQNPVAVVKENPHCPEGLSDEISEYLPVGTQLYSRPFQTIAAPQPPCVLTDPPSHEESYQNNLTQALRERDTLRDILKLLAPDLKAMAAAAQAMGNPARAQALNNICKGVEL